MFGSTLTITPVAAGVTDITISATDGTHFAYTTFKVMVYTPPELRTDTEMSGIVDHDAETSVDAGSLTIYISQRFQDRIFPGKN